jgi:hypothetical protein
MYMLPKNQDWLRVVRPRFDSRQDRAGIYFATTSKLAQEPTQPPIQWVLIVKSQEYEAYHLPPSSAKVKNAWSYVSSDPYTSSYAVLN